MARTRIKICGVRDVETALVAAECGADAVGLVFAPGSRRRVEPEDAWAIASSLPPFVARVGLFVDATAEQCHAIMEQCPCDLVQLHGDESVETARAYGLRAIKALRFDPATIQSEFRTWEDVAEIDALLIDGGSGGQGVSLDWKALADVQHSCVHPIVLAGGLTPENVGEAIAILRPWAVDVSSGVEREPGVKDPALISAFCEAVRQADSA